MCKITTEKALKLKEFIECIEDFNLLSPKPCPYMDHIGAIFTDSILQAGLNYRTVVWPRVNFVLHMYPYADTVSSFSDVLGNYGASNVLHLNNTEKINRIDDLISLCLDNGIDTARQLTDFLKNDDNLVALKSIHGIGDKTCDYMKRLLGFDIVAVDRHVRAFIENADIYCHDYYDIKKVVEYTADFIGCARRELDFSIWNYMSEKEHKTIQLEFDF